MSKLLEHIIKGIPVVGSKGSMQVGVSSIESNSRNVGAGYLFVAVSGTKTDGHTYIQSAIEQGATSVLCERYPEEINPSVTYVQVKDSAEALGLALSNFYDKPSLRMQVVGVTGTNGKTTTATLLYNMFMKLGYKSGLLSTVVNYIGTESFEATHTTPDPVQLYQLFSQMVDAGCEYCFMEVSSHAIHQKRISGIHFTGAVFSNITHDHLDYHKTFDEYIKAKKLFFDALPSDAFALTNVDDKNGMVMLQNTSANKFTYSCKSFSDFKCKVIEKHFDGTLLSIDDTEVWVTFIGDFNAYNLLAVYAAARLLGQPKDDILQIMSVLVAVDGRFECFRSSNGITAIVDYAHTPDALMNVLSTIQKLNTNKGQVITVVGAGGDRDKTKRPVMAKVSVEASDKVILTSDNPRSEDPNQIASEMFSGVPTGFLHKVLTIIDRKEAIRTAIMMARPGDIILIAGKGHETYQEVKGVKTHFDDREIVKEIYSLLKIDK